MHRDIAGTDARGRRYHALNADAYLWVHATGYAGGADIRRVFGSPLDEETEAATFREWQDVARVLGIPERVIPPTRQAFWDYCHRTIDECLERNAATDLLLKLDRKPMPAPPNLRVPHLMWNALATPPAALLRLTTAGILPAHIRDRLGIEWSEQRARRFDRAVTVVRALDRALPDRLRHPAAHRTATLP